jgi:hypothetical protein
MTQSLHLANGLLASLRAEELAGLLPYLKVVELPQETVLYESEDTIQAVYSLSADSFHWSSTSPPAK